MSALLDDEEPAPLDAEDVFDRVGGSLGHLHMGRPLAQITARGYTHHRRRVAVSAMAGVAAITVLGGAVAVAQSGNPVHAVATADGTTGASGVTGTAPMTDPDWTVTALPGGGYTIAISALGDVARLNGTLESLGIEIKVAEQPPAGSETACPATGSGTPTTTGSPTATGSATTTGSPTTTGSATATGSATTTGTAIATGSATATGTPTSTPTGTTPATATGTPTATTSDTATATTSTTGSATGTGSLTQGTSATSATSTPPSTATGPGAPSPTPISFPGFGTFAAFTLTDLPRESVVSFTSVGRGRQAPLGSIRISEECLSLFGTRS